MGSLLKISDRFQQPENTSGDYIGGIFGLIKTDPHMRLRRQIIYFVGRDFFQHSPETGAVRDISIV